MVGQLSFLTIYHIFALIGVDYMLEGLEVIMDDFRHGIRGEVFNLGYYSSGFIPGGLGFGYWIFIGMFIRQY